MNEIAFSILYLKEPESHNPSVAASCSNSCLDFKSEDIQIMPDNKIILKLNYDPEINSDV